MVPDVSMRAHRFPAPAEADASQGVRPAPLMDRRWMPSFLSSAQDVNGRRPPRSLGASGVVHDRLRLWRNHGVFKRMWIAGLPASDRQIGMSGEWPILDDTIPKAPLGGGTWS